MIGKAKSATAHAEGALAKAFVNIDGKTTLVCPKCNTVKSVSVEHFRQRQHTLKVRCACSNMFRVNLDFRKCYRKPTNLEGLFAMMPPAMGGGKVKILNLSLDGICFEISGAQRLQAGQKGRIDFTLDDRKATSMRRDFTVRAVQGNSVGCEFHKSHAFEKELGFYLRFGP